MKFLAGALLLVASAASAQQGALVYVPLAKPCRMVDTRVGPDPKLEAGKVRAFTATGLCGIPYEAKALETNLTVTETEGAGHLAIMRPAARIPDSAPENHSSVLNYSGPGQTIANAALITLGSTGGHNWDGSFWTSSVHAGAHLIVDVSGYYVALAP